MKKDKRHALLSKARKRRISNDKLGSTEEGPVFVNEDLTHTNKKLLELHVKSKLGGSLSGPLDARCSHKRP